MAFSAARLTCYAIISAIEEDLRDLVPSEVTAKAAAEALPPTKASEVIARAKRAGHSARTDARLGDVLIYTDFGDVLQLLTTHKGVLDEPTLAVLEGMYAQLEKLIPIRNRVAHTRPLELEDIYVCMDTGKGLAREHAASFPSARSVLDRLDSDPSYVLGLDIRFPNVEEANGPKHNLPLPDFDETGFVGRRTLLSNLRKKILGPYPVISLVGDGGIGKTATALKACYDLLDDPDVKFDAIVWATAKTTLLTVTEIKRIEDAIQDSLGLLRVAAIELGGDVAAASPMTEVLEYLSAFRVLLVLDNLETVLDPTLRDFLEALPAGSKVLLTSRVGVGAFENPIRMQPLDLPEAVRLLRSLAKSRSVEVLANQPTDYVEALAKQLRLHPLYIRWFVSAVQAGVRPEDALASDDLLLDFCMSNVYEFLSDNSLTVLRSLQAVPGLHTQADMAYLNALDVGDLQAAVLQLMNTNFIKMKSDTSGNAVTTRYEITDFAKQYLDRRHPVEDEDVLRLRDKLGQLSEVGRLIEERVRTSPYNPESIDVRDSGDLPVAAKLLEALDAQRKGNSERARELVTEVRGLAPDYFEAHRVEAQIRAESQDNVRARQSFEKAQELNPNSPVLLCFHARFLRDSGMAPKAALPKMQKAAALDPCPLLVMEVARCHRATGDREAAVAVAASVLSGGNATADWRANAFDFIAESISETAVAKWRAKDDSGVAIAGEDLIDHLRLMQGIPKSANSIDRTHHVLQLLDLLAQADAGYPSRSAIKVASEMRGLLGVPGLDYRRRGYVAKVVDKGYGFVKPLEGGSDRFFHASDLSPRGTFDALTVGVDISFKEVVGRDGPVAKLVRLL